MPQKLPDDLGNNAKFLVIGSHYSATNLRIGHTKSIYYKDDKIVCTDDAKVYIGNYCTLTNVIINIGGEHNYRWVATNSPPMDIVITNKEEKPSSSLRCYHDGVFDSSVHIGNDVWIADDCKILAGVTIGDGAVVGCNSVVTKDVPPYAIVAGNPAKFIRFRFSKDIIDKLLKIKWWDWSLDKIYTFLPLIYSSNVERFIEMSEKC